MTCKNCMHYDICNQLAGIKIKTMMSSGNCDWCPDAKDKLLCVELPCKVGTPYYTISATCSDGGYHTKGEHFPHDSDCEGCCEECDKEYVVREHRFNSVIAILDKKEYIGKTIFLDKKEAENVLRGLEHENG